MTIKPAIHTKMLLTEHAASSDSSKLVVQRSMYKMPSLPVELICNIMGYLEHIDLLRCTRVCNVWLSNDMRRSNALPLGLQVLPQACE